MIKPPSWSEQISPERSDQANGNYRDATEPEIGDKASDDTAENTTNSGAAAAIAGRQESSDLNIWELSQISMLRPIGDAELASVVADGNVAKTAGGGANTNGRHSAAQLGRILKNGGGDEKTDGKQQPQQQQQQQEQLPRQQQEQLRQQHQHLLALSLPIHTVWLDDGGAEDKDYQEEEYSSPSFFR